MNDPKRAEIKARIAAAQARDQQREQPGLGEKIETGATQATGKVTAFVKAHPVASVAGAVAAGILVASLFKGPRRAAVRTGVAAGAKAAGLASLGSEMVLSFLSQMRENAADAGREGAERLDDLGDSLSDTARSLRREAGYRVDTASDQARIASRDLGKALARKLRHQA